MALDWWQSIYIGIELSSGSCASALLYAASCSFCKSHDILMSVLPLSAFFQFPS